MNFDQIARVCHEANKGLCEAQGDFSQKTWEEADEWQRKSAVAGIVTALEGASPEEQHEAWCDYKYNDGWVYGKIKDAELKTHPCLVPYYQLPLEQKLKDRLYVAVVAALKDY